MRLAQASHRSGEPPREITERAAAALLDRRRFLAAGATAAAGVAAARCVAPMGMMAGGGAPPVVVVGAGIAGLTAAYRLRQAGISVRVLETQRRVGGRMFSLRNFFPEGQVAELGGELIDSNHHAIRNLAAELGIAIDDLDQDDPRLGRELWYFGGARRSGAEVVEAFRPIAARIEADLATITGDDVTAAEPNGAEALDRMTVAEWLDRAGVSGWMRTLLDVAYTTEYGLEIGEQSALNFLMMIDTNPDPFRIFGESDERFHVHGGNDAITNALAERLDGVIETTTGVEAIREAGDGTYRCMVRRGGTSFAIGAEAVVMTVPFTILRQMQLDIPISPAKRRAIDELGYGTNAKLMTGYSSRPWRDAGSNGSVLADLPFQLCWETSRLQPGKGGILTNFSGGEHGIEVGRGSERDQAQRLVADLERIFPGVAAAHAGQKAVRFHWPTNPYVRGSYASYKPGQWTAFRGVEGTREGRVFFAGEHTSLESQGFMNGGCETGERAAQEVIAALGRRVRAA
jgi:monoamine oxidase